MEDKGSAVPQGYISLQSTKLGAGEATQVVRQESVTVPSSISASASEKSMANQEHDIIMDPTPCQVQMCTCTNLSLSLLKAMCCSLSWFNKQFHIQDCKRCLITFPWSGLLIGCQSQMQLRTHEHSPFGLVHFWEGANVGYCYTFACLYNWVIQSLQEPIGSLPLVSLDFPQVISYWSTLAKRMPLA